jgi:hypothetical protein
MTISSTSTTLPVVVATGALPPPSSSLGHVLADLGHDCDGSCAAAADELGAHVWFLRRRGPGNGRADSTLVVLDASGVHGLLHRSRQLMREINDCVRDDGIRVTERRIDDSGRALATVSSLHGDPLVQTSDDHVGVVTAMTS